MTMQNPAQASPRTLHREPWNKGKLIGAKPPLRSKHVWSVRTKLQVEGQTRDLAMFNLAIDSKLRGCDVVALKVEDVAPSGYTLGFVIFPELTQLDFTGPQQVLARLPKSAMHIVAKSTNPVTAFGFDLHTWRHHRRHSSDG
jgi:hypothetical protein